MTRVEDVSRAPFRFTATRRFTWERTKEDGSTFVVGEYCPGSTYTCSAAPRHDDLAAKCAEWEAAGQIVRF